MAEAGLATKQSDGEYSVVKLRRQYRDFEGSKSAEIEEQRKARHYYHGDQLTAAELATLKKRRQPPVISNRIGRKVDAIVGLLERMRQDPKAFGRTPKEEQPKATAQRPGSEAEATVGMSGSEIATSVIRYTLDANDWQSISSEAARECAMVGIGGLEYSLEAGDHGDPEIKLAQVDTETFFYDPRSVRLDFSDARFMGIAKWVDLDWAKEMFPEKEGDIDSLMSEGGAGESVKLQDREKHWVDNDEKRLFLIEHWYQAGSEWRYCYYVDDTELKSGSSPFTNEKNKTICRFRMFSANVDHDGDRYGFIRNLKPLQDEINARRSKGLHQLNTRRIKMTADAVEDVDKLRTEAARPDGIIIHNPGSELEFDDAAKAADIAGQLEFLTRTNAEIENFGFNPALIGTGVQDMSGRAIQLQQQAGIAELGPFIISNRGWKIGVYRDIWNIVQKYWTAERWIRVTDDEGLAQFLQLNALQLDERGQPVLANELGSLDVDIILDEGPDTITMTQDTYDTLSTLAKGGLQMPPEVLIELSPLESRVKQKVIGMIEKSRQVDPQKAQLEMEGAKATVGKTKAEALDKMASASQRYAEIQMMPQQMAIDGQQQPQEAQKPPSKSISYNDLPPEGQAQMLAQAGIMIPPQILAAYAEQQAQAEAEQARQRMTDRQRQPA